MSLWKHVFNGIARVLNSPLRFIHCPKCKRVHCDQGEWAGKPHRTHLCEFCGEKWVHNSTVRTVGI